MRAAQFLRPFTAAVPSAVWGLLIVGAVSVVRAEPIQVAELAADREVEYWSDIAPVLKKNCVACHNQSTDEAGVNLESPDAMKASDAEDLLVPGEPESSRLFLLAAHADDPVMPPSDNDVSASSLTSMELALLKRWIQAGAHYDPSPPGDSPLTIQALPAHVTTVYASAITPDGDLSAVGFGNQINVFSRRSSQPLETVQQRVDGKPQPPHLDFVQALHFDPRGQTLVSAGYRNVKLWRRQPFEKVTIPMIDARETLALTINNAGTHVAAVSPRGEVSVARVGKQRWDWMKGFDLPQPGESELRLTLAADGQTAAVSLGKQIWVVGSGRSDVASVTCAGEVRCLDFPDRDTILVGHPAGQVTRLKNESGEWIANVYQAGDQSLSLIARDAVGSGKLVCVDDAGGVWNWNAETQVFDSAGKFPKPVSHVSVTGDQQLWVATNEGALGTFDLAQQKFVDVAANDPVLQRGFANSQWASIVAQRVVAATEDELKQAEANVTAEKESLEKLSKDIEASLKSQQEAEKALADAKAKADADAKAAADAKVAEQSGNHQRKELTASIAKTDAAIQELEKQLADLKKQKQDAEAKLAKIPDEKALAETVKKTAEAAQKSSDDVGKKQAALDEQTASLELAKASRERGAKRLSELNQDVGMRQQSVETAKSHLAKQKENEQHAKTEFEKSRASAKHLGTMSSGTRIITDREDGSGLNLWSGDGTWLGNLSDAGEWIASGDQTLLLRRDDHSIVAWKLSSTPWQMSRQIGAAVGESPFDDRVLCVDVDPSGRYLATGGGLPSRTGELMIWNLRDGTLVRRIENPHADTVLCVRFSPDGKTLASGGADRMVHLWDVASGQKQGTLEGHTHHVTAVAWDLDGRELSSAAADGIIKVWDLKTGKASRTIEGIKSEVTRLDYLGSERRIAITTGDGYFSVYRADNGRRETHVKVPAGYLYALGRNRDGSELIVGGADGVAVLIDKTGKTLQSYGAKP